MPRIHRGRYLTHSSTSLNRDLDDHEDNSLTLLGMWSAASVKSQFQATVRPWEILL